MKRIVTHSPLFALSLALSLVPAVASAQKAPTKDKEAVVYNEIERGAFFGVQGGTLSFLNAPAAAGTPRPFSLGQMAFVEAGYELGDQLALGVFLMGSQNRASSTYVGYSNGLASGDFSALIPGVTARFNAVGFEDGQGVKRTWLYLRGGAGYAMFSPKTLLPNGDVYAFAGPGIEYFTRLRHFSIGLEATGSYLVSTGTIGFSVSPNLRFAF